MTDSPFPNPMTSREVARAVGVCLPTFRGLVAGGEGPRGYVIGGRWRFRPEAVREWIAEREARFAAERAA